MRILFVDDEPHILQGLRRLLHGMRGQWEMYFAGSGREALEILAEGNFQVIVTDMKMPGMDGAELLHETERRHPGVVRIVLSGHADQEQALRALPVAHQFLSKPCEAERLKEVVGRACRLRELMEDESIRALVGGMDQLPILPETYRELTRAIANPETPMGRIAEIVSRSPAVGARVLQVVNSAFLGLPQDITTVEHAVRYIGTDMLRNLVLMMEVAQVFDLDRRVRGFHLKSLQQHGLMVGRLAQQMVREKKAGEQAFLAGILHDIGQLVLAATIPEHLEEALAVSVRSQKPLFLVEHELKGLCHAEIGAYLLGCWGLPYPVVEAVAFHHDPRRGEPGPWGILGSIHLANLLVHEQRIRSPRSRIEASAGVDVAYLMENGVGTRLPDWREMAAGICEREEKEGQHV